MESHFKVGIGVSVLVVTIILLCFAAIITEQSSRHRCVLEAVKTVSADDANKICK